MSMRCAARSKACRRKSTSATTTTSAGCYTIERLLVEKGVLKQAEIDARVAALEKQGG